MGATFRSNNRATSGTAIPTTQPNILDYLTTTTERTVQLKKLISTVYGGDVNYITDANSDSLYNTLQAHRQRVIGDKGEIISVANTLNAIIFAAKNGITAAMASAYSPDFGIKLNGTNVVKIYDLYGRDFEILTGTLEFTLDGPLSVVKNLVTSTMVSKSASIVGNQGMILGACVHDADAGSSSTQAVRGMYMSDNPNASGTSLGHIETNSGGQTRLYYRRQTDDALTSLPYDQTTNYKKFAGLVGYMSNSNTRVEIYENGVVKAGATAAQKDISAINIYPTMTLQSLNSYFNESWLIRSTSQTLAISLSNYLNRSGLFP